MGALTRTFFLSKGVSEGGGGGPVTPPKIIEEKEDGDGNI